MRVGLFEYQYSKMCADEKNIKKKKSFLESLVGYKTSELQMTDDIMFTSTLTPSREIVLLMAIPFAFYLREMPKNRNGATTVCNQDCRMHTARAALCEMLTGK